MLTYLKSTPKLNRNPTEEPSRFQNVFKSFTVAFAINGTDPHFPRNFTYWAKTVLCHAINLFCLFLLVYSLIFHDIKEGGMSAYQNGFMAVIWFLIMTDYYTVLLNKDNLRDMIKSVNEDFARAVNYNREEQDIMDKYIAKGIAISKLWVLTSFATAALFPTKSAILMIYYSAIGDFHLVPFIDVTLPTFISAGNQYLVYFVISSIEFCFALVSATIFIMYPPLGPVFTAHACGQLEVVERRLRALYSGAVDEKSVNGKLREIIVIQQRTFGFIDRLNIIFKISYEISLKYSSIGIPLTLFQIKQAVKTNNLNVELVGFLVGNVMHSFIPCLYSDYLEEKGTAINNAIYDCGWETCFQRRNRKIIFIMLMRSQKLPKIESIFQVLCLQAFADTCKSAYTLFNLMTLMWE